MTFGLFIGALALIFFFYYPRLIFPFLLLTGIGFGIFFVIAIIYVVSVPSHTNDSSTTYNPASLQTLGYMSPAVDPWSEEARMSACTKNAPYNQCKCLGDYIWGNYTEAQIKDFTQANNMPDDVKNQANYCQQNFK